MKALVLAGGTGSRLRPLSNTMPKQLVPVAGKPVLFHCLEAIRAAGLVDTGIVVGQWEQAIREAVGDGSAFGLRVTYLRQREPLGLAHCVLIAREFLGDDDFVMYLGDNVLAGGIADFVDTFRANRADAQLLVGKVTEPSEYGIATLDQDWRVLKVEEKPANPSSDLALVGVYLFGPAVHEAVRAISRSGRGELEITDAIQWLLTSGGAVRAHVYPAYWKDTGQVEDLLDCNRVLLERLTPSIEGWVDEDSEISGAVVVRPGARITRSRVQGPAVIGPGTIVTDSAIGPLASLGSGCRIEAAGVTDSMVLDGASIQRVNRITRSVIGSASRVRAGRETTGTHRLVLGANSSAEVCIGQDLEEDR